MGAGVPPEIVTVQISLVLEPCRALRENSGGLRNGSRRERTIKETTTTAANPAQRTQAREAPRAHQPGE